MAYSFQWLFYLSWFMSGMADTVGEPVHVNCNCDTDQLVLAITRLQEKITSLENAVNQVTSNTEEASFCGLQAGPQCLQAPSGAVYDVIVRQEEGASWLQFGLTDVNFDYTSSLDPLRIQLLRPDEIQAYYAFFSSCASVRVETDLEFRMVADDATNPSTVSTMSPCEQTTQSYVIGAGRDHTSLQYQSDTAALKCIGSSGGTACGSRHMPTAGTSTGRLIITDIDMHPRDGTASSDQFETRLYYNLRMTHYHVLVRLEVCPA